MRFGNYEKIKRIRETEKELEKIHVGIKMFCSNKECKNAVVLKPDESERAIMCGKCHSGFFVKKKAEDKKKEEKDKNHDKKKKDQ